MNIVPLSRKYLEETKKMVSGVFPDDVDKIWNPNRSFDLGIQFAENPEKKQKALRELRYWIVLNEKDEVIGTTGLYQPDNKEPDTVWLGWFCVRGDQRGKGLGRELLEWTIDKARSQGYKRFKLYTTNSADEARAQELYEKLGLKIIGTEKSEDGGYDTLYREKIL